MLPDSSERVSKFRIEGIAIHISGSFDWHGMSAAMVVGRQVRCRLCDGITLGADFGPRQVATKARCSEKRESEKHGLRFPIPPS